MTNDKITSPESIANLIALWTEEAGETATAQQVGYGYVSDFFKYEAGNGFRPRWMSEYDVEDLALAYARMYANAEAEAKAEAEGKRKEAAALVPAPAWTIGDIVLAL